MRYIELNPVRAAMVDDPAHYRWTSYRANALAQPSSIITPHKLYLELGPSTAARMDVYRGLFRTALDQIAIDDIRLAFNQNQPLGDSRFYTKIERILGERRQAKPQGRPKRAGASSSEAEEIQGLLKLE